MFEPSKESDDPIRKYQSELRDLHTLADNLRPVLTACQDAIARAQSKAICILESQVLRPTILIMLLADSLDESVALIRELAKDGIRSRDKKFEDTSLFDAIAMRQYHLTNDVSLTVMLIGEQCKLQQVGTKVVPVYEMRCGDGSQLKDDAPQAALPIF